jgi:hypothetical protein
MPLVSQRDDRHPNALGFTGVDYVELTDWAGRVTREDKRGAIPTDAPSILQRLGLEPERYLDHVAGSGGMERPVVIGRLDRIKEMADTLGRRFIKGFGESRRLYRPLAV